MHDLPTTEPAIDLFIAAFEDGSLPKARWTHPAHLLTGACYVHALGEADAIVRMRARVSAYNFAVGGQNTPTSGYHETVTVFWIKLLALTLTHLRALDPGLSRADFAHHAVTTLSPYRNLYAEFYDFDLLTSPEARRAWIPPNRRTLDEPSRLY
jgi:hypothetical protein